MSIVESIMLTGTTFVSLFLYPNVKQIIIDHIKVIIIIKDQPFKIVAFVRRNHLLLTRR